MKHILLSVFILLTYNIKSQDIELIHSISSNQTYYIPLENDEILTIHLNFYSPGVIDYKELPFFLVSGWYELEANIKKNLVGIYRPSNNLVLFVPEDSTPTHIDCIDDTGLNIDTTKYLERFYFPLNDNVERIKNAIWSNGDKETLINTIDFDKKNVCHKIVIRGGDWWHHVNPSLDITDFVISPFGNNDIFLEDYNINIHSSNLDSLGNLHLLFFITNEYVVPSSLSSGGYYYLMLDKYQSITRSNYLETYNQGKYMSYFDDTFRHPTKKRFLIIADWSDSQVIGSFFIDNSRIEIENEW